MVGAGGFVEVSTGGRLGSPPTATDIIIHTVKTERIDAGAWGERDPR
jgi:hypothetical protein